MDKPSKEKFRDDSVDEWNLAIADGLEYRRLYGREPEWAKCEALFYQADERQNANVGPNILSSTGDALLSTLLVPNPYFVLKALRMDTVECTPILESILNTLIYSLKIKESFEQSGLHAFLYGRGIVKLGYDSEFGYDPSTDLGFKHNNILGISLTQFDKKGQKIEYNDYSPGMPWCAPVMPHDFVVPWGTGPKLTSAPWCAHRIIRHVDDVKADKKYENTKDLYPSLSMSDYMKSYLTVMKPYRMGDSNQSSIRRRDGTDKAEYVEMWEIHDTRTGRVKVIATGYDKFLRDEIDYLQEDGLPFVSFGFVPQSRSFWNTPDSVYLQATQNEAIDIAEMQRKSRRISTLRFLHEEGTIEPDELEKFMSGVIGVSVKYKPNGGQGAPITALNPQTANNVLQQEAESIRRDARETVGFGRNQMGEYEGTGRRTASEAMIVQQNADQRLTRREQIVADGYCELGRKISKTIFKFWKTPRLTEIVGPDGAVQWQSFTGSQLKGEYQFRIGFSHEPLEGLQARRQAAIGIYQLLVQDPSINQIELRRYLARAFNDPEFNRLFQPGVIINANLPNAMQQLQQPMGGNNSQTSVGGAGGPGIMPGVQQQQNQSSVQQQSSSLQAVGQR